MTNLSDLHVGIQEFHRMNHLLNQEGWKQTSSLKKRYFSSWFEKAQ